jgi:hypothetical protein
VNEQLERLLACAETEYPGYVPTNADMRTVAAEVRKLRARDEAGAAVVREARQAVKPGGFPGLTDALAAYDALARVHETDGGA